MQQRCPNCGSPVIPGQRFCGGCGAQLSLSCPQCRITVSPGTSFCPNCGSTLGGGSTQQPGFGTPGGMPPQQSGWGQQPGMSPQQPGWGQQQPGWGQQQPWAPPTPKSQPSSSNRPLLIMLLIILLIGLGGFIYWQRDLLFAFMSPSSSSSTTTTTDTTKPVITSISEPSVDTQSLGPTSANIGWKTDVLSSSQVEYGTDTTYGSVQPPTLTDDPTSGTSLGVVTHAVVLSGLTPSTTYHYRVKSKNKVGETVSDDKTFTTTAAESS